MVIQLFKKKLRLLGYEVSEQLISSRTTKEIVKVKVFQEQTSRPRPQKTSSSFVYCLEDYIAGCACTIYLVAQWLGRRTFDLAVMGSIPGPRVIRHLGQLSLPSLGGR